MSHPLMIGRSSDHLRRVARQLPARVTHAALPPCPARSQSPSSDDFLYVLKGALRALPGPAAACGPPSPSGLRPSGRRPRRGRPLGSRHGQRAQRVSPYKSATQPRASSRPRHVSRAPPVPAPARPQTGNCGDEGSVCGEECSGRGACRRRRLLAADALGWLLLADNDASQAAPELWWSGVQCGGELFEFAGGDG
jgi:hypothetical protein